MAPTLMMLVAGALSAYSPAEAAQLRLTRAELCTVSDLVLVAEVTSGETRWADGTAGGIERIRWVAVRHLVSGGTRPSQASNTVEVVLPGGTIGELTQWVEDVPELLGNSTYLLFLAETDGELRVVGGEQGAVRIAERTGQKGEPLARALSSVEVCHAS